MKQLWPNILISTLVKSAEYRFLLLAVALLIAFVFGGCQQENKKPAVFASGLNGTEIPVQQIWNMKVLQTDSSKVIYRMYGGYAKGTNTDLSRNSLLDIDSGLTIIFYKDGKTFGRLDSRRGTMDQLNNIFVAIDSVVLKSPAGYTVYTQKLTLNRLEKRIFTDLPVMSVKDNDTLWGDGFVSAENLEEYNIVNPRGKAFLSDEKVKNVNEKDE